MRKTLHLSCRDFAQRSRDIPISSNQYYRARYYDAQIGRFTSEDPIGFAAGTNFYQYAENEPNLFADPLGFQSGWTDLRAWFNGDSYANRYHDNDGVTAALAKSPVMSEIRDKYKKSGCKDGLYCGEFHLYQAVNPRNANLVVQSVGSFCAYLTRIGDDVQIDAFNEWGGKSLTHIPETKQSDPSVEDMIDGKAHWGVPSSIFNNKKNGTMARMRFWYHWTEKSSCCKN